MPDVRILPLSPTTAWVRAAPLIFCWSTIRRSVYEASLANKKKSLSLSENIVEWWINKVTTRERDRDKALNVCMCFEVTSVFDPPVSINNEAIIGSLWLILSYYKALIQAERVRAMNDTQINIIKGVLLLFALILLFPPFECGLYGSEKTIGLLFSTPCAGGDVVWNWVLMELVITTLFAAAALIHYGGEEDTPEEKE